MIKYRLFFVLTLVNLWAFGQHDVTGIKAIQATISPDELQAELEEISNATFMPCHALTFNVDNPQPVIKDNKYYWQIDGEGFNIRAFIQSEKIPQGDTLFALDNQGRKLHYLTSENQIQQKWSTPLALNRLTLMYKGRHQPSLILKYYSLEIPTKMSEDFGDSGACEVNANCNEGNNHRDIQKSIVRILIKNGGAQYYCTGSLLNNSAYDFRPYLLTAQHCALNNSNNFVTDADLEEWVFYFNYEANGCNSPSSEGNLANQQIIGASVRAHSNDLGGTTGSDFLLLELKTSVPAIFDPYFAGWDRQNSAPTNGITYHHPEGDIKKISTFSSVARSGEYTASASNTHWLVDWVATTHGHGVTEGGSSGCPLINQNNLISGTLTGGFASCFDKTSDDFFGKFSYHWDQNGNTADRRLMDWLDPGKTGVSVLNGATLGDTAPDLESGKITLSPNPATDGYIEISGLGAIKNQKIAIFNLFGKQVYPATDSQVFYDLELSDKINVEHLPNGPYFLRIINNKGTEAVKFIVKN